MSQWWISVPAWGERYLSIFERATMPALQFAIRELQSQNHNVEIVIHTDNRDRAAQAVGGVADTHFLEVPPPDGAFESLSQAHRQVIHMATRNSRVCLLTSDLILSRNALVSCESRFAEGYVKVIGCAGMRACEETLPVPGMSGRELLAWGWDHRHPMTQECTWSEGTSYDLWRMYFAKDDEVVCRLCLPHPIAFVRDRPGMLDFRPTIDVNLIGNWQMNEMYIVTNPDELGLIELSPRDKEFVRTEPMWKRFREFLPGVPTFSHLTTPRHNWLFNHKIIIKGTGGDVGDELVVARMVHGA